MASYTMGRVGIVPKDEYSPTVTYSALDLVPYQGTAYVAKAQTTGIVPTNTAYWTPVISGVNTNDATAAAANIAPGYTAYVKGSKLTGTLPAYTGSYSVTPTTSTQTLATSGKYCTSNITIGAGGTNTNDATAYAADIWENKTAYARGAKITGILGNYSGPVATNPSSAKQTLMTANKYLTSNITVNENLVFVSPYVAVSSNKLSITLARRPFVLWIKFKTASNSYLLGWNSSNGNVMQSTNSGGVHTNSLFEWKDNDGKAEITLRNDTNTAFTAAVTVESCYCA